MIPKRKEINAKKSNIVQPQKKNGNSFFSGKVIISIIAIMLSLIGEIYASVLFLILFILWNGVSKNKEIKKKEKKEMVKNSFVEWVKKEKNESGFYFLLAIILLIVISVLFFLILFFINLFIV